MGTITPADLPFSSLLLDTNVWLDYYLAARPHHQTAFRLINQACACGVELLYTVGGSKDVYYLTALYFKRAARASNGGVLTASHAQAAAQAAWACLDHMDEIAAVVGCDQSDVWLARKQRPLHADYEDDLVIAAAQRAQETCLVTNDAQLIAHAPVPVLSPSDVLIYLEGAGA